MKHQEPQLLLSPLPGIYFDSHLTLVACPLYCGCKRRFSSLCGSVHCVQILELKVVGAKASGARSSTQCVY